jgi:hypothetical protein
MHWLIVICLHGQNTFPIDNKLYIDVPYGIPSPSTKKVNLYFKAHTISISYSYAYEKNGTVIWGNTNTGRDINFKVILKIVRKGFWEFYFIKRYINYCNFHIKAIFDGFGMGSTVPNFFLNVS